MSSFTALLARGFRTHWARNEFSSPSSLVLQARSRFHAAARVNMIFRQTHNFTPGRPMARSGTSPFFMAVGMAGIGLGLSKSIPRVYCDAPPDASPTPQSAPELPPPPPSTVSLYQLSFGIVSGICAGIFIKKGAKAAAWLLGGIFVLLQYLASKSLVHVDWGRMATRFENALYTTDEKGLKKAPTVASLWTWLVDFLTADFQPRASFIAGLALGLRIG